MRQDGSIREGCTQGLGQEENLVILRRLILRDISTRLWGGSGCPVRPPRWEALRPAARRQRFSSRATSGWYSCSRKQAWGGDDPAWREHSEASADFASPRRLSGTDTLSQPGQPLVRTPEVALTARRVGAARPFCRLSVTTVGWRLEVSDLIRASLLPESSPATPLCLGYSRRTRVPCVLTFLSSVLRVARAAHLPTVVDFP